MITTLASFSYEGRAPLRVFGSPEEPLFIAREVCDALGLSKYRDALQRVPEWAQGRPLRVDTETAGKASTQGGRFPAESVDSDSTVSGATGGRGWLATLTEAGLYYLVLRSDRPEAEAFQAWVCREVLPAIRKAGFYAATGGEPAQLKRLRVLELETEAQRHLLAAEEANRRIQLLRGVPLALPAPGAITVREWLAANRPKLTKGHGPCEIALAVKAYARKAGEPVSRICPTGNPSRSVAVYRPEVIAAAIEAFLNLRGGVR